MRKAEADSAADMQKLTGGAATWAVCSVRCSSIFPAALERLTEQFARLPGIGSKTAQRLAFQILSLPQEQAEAFADAILDAKRTVHTCPVCQNLTDQRALRHLR